MNSRLGKTIALVAVTLALQVSVMGVPGLTGKLRTRNNKPVLVNSHKAGSGTTILSGAQIQCPAKIGATVDLGRLGRLDMAPKTDLRISFSATEVNIQLTSGYVVLSTRKGISGTVTTSEGTVFRTDSSMASSVVARTKGSEGPETAAQIGAAAGGIGMTGTATVVGVGAAVVGGSAVSKGSGRGSSLSSDNPRVP